MRFLKQFFALIFLLTIEHSQAAGKFYTQQEFDTLLAEGKTLVVHIHADWCGTCKAQDIQINSAINSAEFKDVVFFCGASSSYCCHFGQYIKLIKLRIAIDNILILALYCNK